MSFAELYAGSGPKIASSGGEAVATVIGVPFDSTHSYKPGTRFGPDAIRGAFNNIEVFHESLGVDLESASIEDLGNIRHTVVSTEMLDMLGKITGELLGNGRQIIYLGGEHLITYGTYSHFPKGTGFVVFDAHYDLRDSYAGARLSHASFLRRTIEDRGTANIVHVGARAFCAEEAQFLAENRINTISDADIRAGRGPAMLRDAISTFDDAYVSYDLDVLDPAFAPGVGNPEACGITSRELFDMMRAFEGVKVGGMDIVELNPAYDNGATAALAAKIISSMIAMNLSRTGV